MGALLRARALVGGGPGRPRERPWTVQGAPKEARTSRSGRTSPLRGRALASTLLARVPPSAEADDLLPERGLRWRPGRSQARRLLGQLKVAENAPEDGPLGEGGQHPAPAPAAWAGEDVNCERLAE
jgi:hypothetical protein